MTTQATTTTPHGWRVAPRWVILILLALAGLALLAYFQAVLAALLVAAAVVVAIAWVRPFWVMAALLALLPFHEQAIRVVTWQLDLAGQPHHAAVAVEGRSSSSCWPR